MALLRVNPTRMVLMDLKRRTVSAKRGHKLLKDKQDGLMQQFLAIIRDARTLRSRIEKEFGESLRIWLTAGAWLTDAELENTLSSPQTELRLDVRTKNVMSVRIPVFSLQRSGSLQSYAYAGTNALFDHAVRSLDELCETLLRLAEIEKQAENMAIELETTRRRVNALEHRLIPDLKETVKYISMKLGEAERAGIISTMKVKAKITNGRV